MKLDITSVDKSDLRELIVTGEVDVSCAADLRGQLTAAADEGLGVVVDLSGVSYIDSTGIGVLVGAANAAREGDRSFAVRNPQPAVRRVLDMLGVAGELGLED